MRRVIIAIDGYSGTGKSSTAKKVSEYFNYTYIDSGAMYRAVTYYFLENDIDCASEQQVRDALQQISIQFKAGRTFLNDVDVDDEIRSMRVNGSVSQVAALSSVRTKLVEMQRSLAENKGVVMDGRDIGTVVFPEAELKLFMTADMDIRAERRRIQLLKKGVNESFESIKDNFAKRDAIDTTREDSPLRKADDAKEIDTTKLSLEEQIQKIVGMAEEIITG